MYIFINIEINLVILKHNITLKFKKKNYILSKNKKKIIKYIVLKTIMKNNKKRKLFLPEFVNI